MRRSPRPLLLRCRLLPVKAIGVGAYNAVAGSARAHSPRLRTAMVVILSAWALFFSLAPLRALFWLPPLYLGAEAKANPK